MNTRSTVALATAALAATAAFSFSPFGASAAPAGDRGATEAVLDLPDPSNPVDVVENYTRIEEQLLTPHPDEWGGAYVDGATLVVNTVTRSVDDAADVLRSIGVTRGVTVRRVETSMAELDAVTEAIVADPELTPSVAIVGPEYSNGQVVVGVRDGVELTSAAAARLARYGAGSDLPITAYSGIGESTTTARSWATSPFNGAALFGPGA